MNRSREIVRNHLIFKQICRYYGTVRNETYYDVLGIPKDASKQDIRLAYLKLSKEKHPDKNYQESKASHNDFVKINEAYNVLSKDDLKERYDDNLKYGYGYNNASRVSRRSPVYDPEDFHMYDTYYNVQMNANRRNAKFRNGPSERMFTKTQALMICAMIWMIGNLFHVWAIMKSPTFNRQALLERSQKYSAEEKKARNRAYENQQLYRNNAEIALALLMELEEDDQKVDDEKMPSNDFSSVG